MGLENGLKYFHLESCFNKNEKSGFPFREAAFSSGSEENAGRV